MQCFFVKIVSLRPHLITKVMSQRLQSIFFFVSALLFGVLFFEPLAYYLGEYNILRFNVFGVESLLPDGEVPFHRWFALPVLILTITALLLGIYLAVGLRKAIKMNDFVRLLKMARIDLVVIVAWVAVTFAYYIRAIGMPIGVEQPDYRLGAFLPLASMILVLLGTTGLKNDLKKVRSQDRIR